MSRANAVRVLMYHATYADSEALSTVEKEDRPYAVAEQAFEQHVTSLQLSGHEIVSENSVLDTTLTADAPVLLTFDDGHASNRWCATPWLQSRGLSGLFFITTDWTDTREHFCTSEDLRSMHEMGMAIGSHGCSHRFIADLDAASARLELADSKAKLEDILGTAVSSISFPGGRCGKRDVDMAFELGYTAVHGSAFGVHQPGARSLINRLPVREGMNADTVCAMCNPTSSLHRRTALSTFLKTTAKRTLGNGVYDAIYRRFAT